MIAALSLLLLAVQADTTTPPPVLKFTGEAGYVATAGNQSVKTLNVGDKFSAQFGDLVLTQTFARVYGENEEETITSLTRASLRIDKGLKGSPFVAYGLLNYERNVFAGLASRVAGSAGLSAIILRDTRNRVVVESGLSLNRQRGTGTRGRDIDFLGGRAAGTYTHEFAPKASFVQAVELLPNFGETEDLRINTESTVVAPLTARIAVKLSYVVRYDGLPETGFLTTDRLFTSGVQVTL